MKLAGCFKATMISYMPQDQCKFDFSCHDPLTKKLRFLAGRLCPLLIVAPVGLNGSTVCLGLRCF